MINWTNCGASGTYLVGMLTPCNGRMPFQETVARLITLSGQDPTTQTDEYKTSVEFNGSYNGAMFTLYDYKGDREIHIGGTDALDVAGLRAELDAQLLDAEPTNYVATERYDECDGQTHAYDPSGIRLSWRSRSARWRFSEWWPTRIG